MANYYQKAINAVFYANPVKLQQLIDEGHFYNRLLEDTGLLSNPLPIWRIPQLWEAAIGDVSEWSKHVQYLVKDFKSRVHQVKDILGKSFDIEFTPVDYQQYTGDFYASTPDESIEDAFMVSDIKEVYVNGARPIDVELYCAGVKFDFARVEELLKQGANPRAAMEDADCYLSSRIGDECAFLSVNLSHIWKSPRHESLDEEEMSDLVGSAAHEEMFRLLNKYAKKEDEEESSVEEFTFGPDMNPDTAKAWWICDCRFTEIIMVMDASHAHLIEIPMREKNLDNYMACISAYVKDFKALYGADTNRDLAVKMHELHYSDDSIDPFIDKVKGMNQFRVLDYRLTEASSELEKFFHKCTENRYHTLSQEYMMSWYRGVASCLRQAGLSDEEILKKFKKKNIPVLWIQNHDSSATYEGVAQKYLTAEE